MLMFDIPFGGQSLSVLPSYDPCTVESSTDSNSIPIGVREYGYQPYAALRHCYLFRCQGKISSTLWWHLRTQGLYYYSMSAIVSRIKVRHLDGCEGTTFLRNCQIHYFCRFRVFPAFLSTKPRILSMNVILPFFLLLLFNCFVKKYLKKVFFIKKNVPLHCVFIVFGGIRRNASSLFYM